MLSTSLLLKYGYLNEAKNEDEKEKKDEENENENEDTQDNAAEEEPAEDEKTDDADTAPEDEENADDPMAGDDDDPPPENEGGEDEPPADDAGGDEAAGDDAGGMGDEGGGDEFAMPGEDGGEEGGGEDDMSSEPAPDGLAEPDDTGEAEEEMDEDEEGDTNIQINIVNLTDLQRIQADEYMATLFYDMIDAIKRAIDNIDMRASLLDPKIREMMRRELIGVSTELDEYMSTLFQTDNYESHLMKYSIEAATVNGIINKVRESINGKGQKNKRKQPNGLVEQLDGSD